MPGPGDNPPRGFLGWTDYAEPPAAGGMPWGDGSEMADRAKNDVRPWDTGCKVTPLIGGLAAMTAMANALQDAINDINRNHPATRFDANARTWPNGHVYIADWRFNCLRDLSTQNLWHLTGWQGQAANEDRTAIGLVRKLMQAGIQVRLLLWLPHWLGASSLTAGLSAHIEDHQWAARLVEAENRRLMQLWGATQPDDPQLGVVALDMRTAKVKVTSHHQKLMVIRTRTKDIAFAGGVDLAFTRRDDLDPSPTALSRGDWQSGGGIPGAGPWPSEAGVDYATANQTEHPSGRQDSDLPPTVYGDRQQSWHDQHLVLEGPVVSTLEAHFCERWELAGTSCLSSELGGLGSSLSGLVGVSTPEAMHEGQIKRLPPPAPALPYPGGTHLVQMWRTIPLHADRTTGPFQRGEFTVMEGLAQACRQATELIWIFDQYFWSVPLARLLAERVRASRSLHVVIVLPPHADGPYKDAHQARFDALSVLTQGLAADQADRIAVYAMWNPAAGRGIYVHAKVQMFDDELLVCGSANLNRRSFMCDSELAFAVADASVVDAHQRALFTYLFPGLQFPWLPGDPRETGWGADLFQLIRMLKDDKSPAAQPKLIDDPWRGTRGELPNHVIRKRSGSGTGLNVIYNYVLDSSSVDLSVEVGAPTLADIARKLNKYDAATGEFPFRKPA